MQIKHQRESIVVLGAGFGGITALLTLRRRLAKARLGSRFELILVSKTSYHLYTPALYEIAAIPRETASAALLKRSIAIPVSDIISRWPEIKFIGDEVVGLNPEAKTIDLASGQRLAFSFAIVALGVETNYFAIPGLAEWSFPLKTFEDAIRLRNRLEELLAARRSIAIVVGGGGATGVELSAELINFICTLRKRIREGVCEARITMLEAGPEILGGFSPEIVIRARRRLQRLGVSIRTGCPIASIENDRVRLADGSALACDVLIWSGGTQGARASRSLGLATDEKGRIAVNAFLEAAPGVYAVGDVARFDHPLTGRPLPSNVPVAQAEARLAARNILASIRRTPPRPFRPMSHYPFILAVGGKYALTDLVMLKFFGALGWFAKQLVELRYLLFVLPWPQAIGMWLRAITSGSAND